jgi:hypothetical protein
VIAGDLNRVIEIVEKSGLLRDNGEAGEKELALYYVAREILLATE